MNSVNLMGRLTRDPEFRKTEGGASITSFTLAVRRDADHTDFIDCIAWKNTAEFIRDYFSKGNMIAISGRIQARDFKDKNGNGRHVQEVVADHAFFTGGKSENEKSTDFKPVDDDGELPF